jgi:hypothetical protein
VGAALSELAGIFAFGFVLFLILAGPVVLIAAGILLPVFMPVLPIAFFVLAALVNLARKYNEWLDSL